MTAPTGTAPQPLWTLADGLQQDEMDAGHARTGALYGDALAAGPVEFPAAFRALCDHLGAQFAREERLMRMRRFPASRFHAAEHASLLAALRRRAGAPDARAFLAEGFAAWFREHLASMDRATARFLNGEAFAGCARQCGRAAEAAGGRCGTGPARCRPASRMQAGAAAADQPG